jgi:hypothetical protein
VDAEWKEEHDKDEPHGENVSFQAVFVKTYLLQDATKGAGQPLTMAYDLLIITCNNASKDLVMENHGKS